MAIYLSRLFRSSSSCPVLGTTFQERSGPSEEALDRAPNINISKENRWEKAEENGVAPPKVEKEIQNKAKPGRRHYKYLQL